MNKVDAIIKAARAGDLPAVTALLDENPPLATAATMAGSQPVHAAHFGGHAQVVDLLMSRGGTLTPFLAADLGMLDHVEAAMRADPTFPGAFDQSGSTALHRACYWGQTVVARALLDHGAEPNAATRDSFLQIRPLGCGVATPDVPNPSDSEETVLELVRLLLERGADVKGRRRDGLTALHSAAYRGHLRVVSYLLDRGADPAIQGYQGYGPHGGQTALEMAVAQGQKEAAALLRGS